jgi:acetyl-CoA acyltransferase
MRDAVIVSAVRTAIGKAPRGALRDTRPDELAAAVIREAVRRVAGLHPSAGVRADTSLERLAALPPVFAQQGVVTAGNSSQTSDGAAAVVVMAGEAAERMGIRPLGVFRSFAVAGVPSEIMGIGPVEAVPKALRLAGVRSQDIDLIELNEAFASQAVAVARRLELDAERLNVNGGAIALGHPLGCSGARITVTLLHELQRRRARYGVATMCIGGGMGAAGVFERV